MNVWLFGAAVVITVLGPVDAAAVDEIDAVGENASLTSVTPRFATSTLVRAATTSGRSSTVPVVHEALIDAWSSSSEIDCGTLHGSFDPSASPSASRVLRSASSPEMSCARD